MPVNLPNAYTLLTMTGIGVAPYSARGLKQSLTPIDAASQMRRTVNGVLRDISLPQFRRFKSTITGSDQLSPAVAGIWPGMTVTVECICELAVGAGSVDRPVVSGSSRTEEGMQYYRPVLTMLVRSFDIEADEYGAQVSWTMQLEEVGEEDGGGSV
jgi:hypothetical protein